jgi:hypothetical protein
MNLGAIKETFRPSEMSISMGVLMHVVFYNSSPSYLTDRRRFVSMLTGRTRLRSASDSPFDIPPVRTNLGRWSFSVAWPGFRNTLPAFGGPFHTAKGYNFRFFSG